MSEIRRMPRPQVGPRLTRQFRIVSTFRPVREMLLERVAGDIVRLTDKGRDLASVVA
jgi:hypothetical protein